MEEYTVFKRIAICLLILLLAVVAVSCTSPDETDEGTSDPTVTTEPLDPTGPATPAETTEPIDPTGPSTPLPGTGNEGGEVTSDPNVGGTMPGYSGAY